jgi:hypothetical protein
MSDVIKGEFIRDEPIRVELDYQGVTGAVHLAFTDGDHCSVSCNGAWNTRSDRVMFRNKEYLPHVHVYRLSGDDELIVWGVDPKRSYGHYGLDGVAPTYKAKIIAAMVDAVQTHGTQAVIDQATYASAMRDLLRADEKEHELSVELREAREAQSQLRRKVARFRQRVENAGE